MMLTNTFSHSIEIRLPHLASSVAAAAPLALGVAAPALVTSTYGWDTVFAIRLKDVNAAIAKFAVSPHSFEYIPPDQSCSVCGTFGVWQVHRGGDGVLIHFSIPVTDGQLNWQGKVFSMRGVIATAEVRLHYLPHKLAIGSALGNLQKLVVQTASDEQLPVASVIDLQFPEKEPSCIPKALMIGALDEWLNTNLGQFNHIFSVVDLNRIASQQQFQWLAPTATSYAYIDGVDDDSSYLGVLCMTGDRSRAGLAEQISPSAIPPGSRSAFLISQERLLQQMILPVIPHAFPDSVASDFAVAHDGKTITNVRPVKTKTVENKGITYQPWVQHLRVTIDATEVIVDTLTTVDIGLGATATIQNTAYLSIKLATSPNGTQTLTWQEARPPFQDHWVTMDPGTTVAIEIVMLIVMAILTVLTSGAVLVVALIIVALIAGIMELTPQLVAEVVGNRVSDDSPSLNLLVLNATDAIQWPGEKAFKLDWVGLNGALQLCGTPQFDF